VVEVDLPGHAELVFQCLLGVAAWKQQGSICMRPPGHTNRSQAQTKSDRLPCSRAFLYADRARVPTVKWYENLLSWAIAAFIAVGTFCGLFWLGAIVCSHLLGISVFDAFIRMLTAY
jgi:hypothetical protein